MVQRYFRFSLLITPPTVDDSRSADLLYAGGCDDATFGVCNGEYSIDFDRAAYSLGEAVMSALQNVYNSKIGSQVHNIVIEPN